MSDKAWESLEKELPSVYDHYEDIGKCIIPDFAFGDRLDLDRVVELIKARDKEVYELLLKNLSKQE